MKHPVKQAFSLSPGLSHRNVLGLSRSLGIELQQQIILAVWWILLIDQACSLKMACYWPRSTKTKQQNAVTNVARARSITSRLVNNAYPERTLARMYYPLAVENKKFLFLSLFDVNIRRIKHMLERCFASFARCWKWNFCFFYGNIRCTLFRLSVEAISFTCQVLFLFLVRFHKNEKKANTRSCRSVKNILRLTQALAGLCKAG